MSSDSCCSGRPSALVAVAVAILLAACIAAAGAQPAASRAEISAASAGDSAAGDSAAVHSAAQTAVRPAGNGLRPSKRSSRVSRHSKRSEDQPKLYCGSKLRDKLAEMCDGRGYNGVDTKSGTKNGTKKEESKSEGAASHCCLFGCTWRDLDAYCNPLADGVTAPPVTASVEAVNEPEIMTSDEDIPVPSNHQWRSDTVVEEDSKSTSIGLNAQPDTVVGNELTQSPKHIYIVKQNDLHMYIHKSPVSIRSPIR